MSDIKNWSKTAINNSSAPPDGAPEGMAPSTVNDVIRKQMAIHREQWEDAEWFNWGHVPVRQSALSFVVSSTATQIYTAGRKLKLYDASTICASVKASSPSGANTLVSITSTTSIALTTSLSSLAVSILDPAFNSLPFGEATEAARGIIEIASVAETILGTDAVRAISPAGFATGSNVAARGSYNLPGGLIINWGKQTGSSGTFTFDAAYTNLWAVTGAFSNATANSSLRLTGSGVSTVTWTIDSGASSTVWFIAIGN